MGECPTISSVNFHNLLFSLSILKSKRAISKEIQRMLNSVQQDLGYQVRQSPYFHYASHHPQGEGRKRSKVVKDISGTKWGQGKGSANDALAESVSSFTTGDTEQRSPHRNLCCSLNSVSGYIKQPTHSNYITPLQEPSPWQGHLALKALVYLTNAKLENLFIT